MKLTEDHIAFVHTIVLRRRELQRQLRLVPTNAQLAEKLECSLRWIEKISSPKRLKSGPSLTAFAGQSQTKNEQSAKPVEPLRRSNKTHDEQPAELVTRGS
jgi:hypothetical protein